MIKKSIARVGFCFLLAGLASCTDDDTNDLVQYIQDARDTPAGTIPTLPERKITEPFIFEKRGGRNPFVAFDDKKEAEIEEICATENQVQPIPDRKKEVLEDYSLDALKLAGSIGMDDDFWALIKANDSTIYKVQQGNYLGSDYGKITQFNYGKKKEIIAIKLREIVSGQPCPWKEHSTLLTLSK